MGGDGSMHLALKYPGVFSVAAPASGRYDWARRSTLEQGVQSLRTYKFCRLTACAFGIKALFLRPPVLRPTENAAVLPGHAADHVRWKGEIVSEVFDKIAALIGVYDVDRYLAQPERLSEDPDLPR